MGECFLLKYFWVLNGTKVCKYPRRSMYGRFSYIYHKNQPKCRYIYHTIESLGIDCFVSSYLTKRFSQIGAVCILLFTQHVCVHSSRFFSQSELAAAEIPS